MPAAKVMIIDASGDCALSAARVLMPEGFGILAADSREKADRMLAAERPEVIVADVSAEKNPLHWVEEAHR
ncbi:MAG: hypothetical protein LBV79_04965, partial [Candidatus Adiutrix sp.]|nr:hypothetical protein [Candidatus Adiutrix sp.]